ncbi:hypothetical protein [Streptomyces sp. NPDC047928]|uniref:F0F1 ATP synthase subunit B family protein n=1 Tax=unclassified Streptomyces TaxID=2593676 RepID=UPI0037214E81
MPVDILIGLVAFTLTFLIVGKVLLPRINRTLAEREEAIEGRSEQAEELRVQAARVHAEYEAELAAARHEAARIRARAHEEGAAAIAAAGARLADDVESWAHRLAERIVGEPVADRQG